jgi:DinB family protein
VDNEQQDQVLRSREEILRALEHFPTEFRRSVLEAADREALLRPAFDGGWGVVEIIPHLRDWEAIYLDRATRILDEDRPALPGFDDTLWSIERDYRGQDPYETFAHFAALRSELVTLLRAATPEQWERVGIHGVYGEITLQWMANHICDHDAEHLQQAREALTV